MDDSFKTYFHKAKTRALTRNKTRKKSHIKRDPSINPPGQQQTTQNINTKPSATDAPSSSTFVSKG